MGEKEVMVARIAEIGIKVYFVFNDTVNRDIHLVQLHF